jgi:hypothetical protein
MTESTSCITSTPPKYLPYDYAHTVGVLTPSSVLKIVDLSSGKEVGVGEPGEVCETGSELILCEDIPIIFTMRLILNPAISKGSSNHNGLP